MTTQIPWVGDVPSEWRVAPLFSLCTERKRKNTGNGEGNVLSLSYGRIVRRDVASNFGLLPESFETYNVIDRGDLVLRLTDLQNDQTSLRVGLSPERGIITSAYVTLRTREALAAPYAFYLLYAYDVQKVFYGFGGGVRQSMKFEDLRRIPLLCPPLSKQRAIANFLDRKTAAIDSLIAKKERLIELIHEKRQALITQAVTRGLDPNVPMKDSGIEWLGTIPGHWRVCRTKHVMARIVDCPHETPDVSPDYAFPAVRTADVDRGRLLLDQAQRVSEETYRERTRRLVPEEGDILYSREGGRFGHAALVPAGVALCLGQRMMMFRARRLEHDPAYFMWVLNADCTFRQVTQDTLGSAAPRVNIPTVANAWVPCPPRDEQAAIAARIDRSLRNLDTLEAQEASSLGRLGEYRQALIAAAVTGKIDVSKEAA